jgi:energy-coupling factor transport system substrate-specific component
MWILSSDGIYVIPVKERLANRKIDPVHYGIANGIPCTATSNPYNYLTKNGDLYIAGRSGVTMVNIEESLEDIEDLKMSVSCVKADSKYIYPDEKGIFRIPASTKKLAVYAHVYNYSLTDPLVSFMLRGFEREYSTVRRSELGPLYYTNLQGRTYRFDMQIMDAMGRESKNMTATIIKAKAFYEQAWFFILAMILFGVSALAVLQLYVREKMKRSKKSIARRRSAIESSVNCTWQIRYRQVYFRTNSRRSRKRKNSNCLP